jgi:hypothetical protein
LIWTILSRNLLGVVLFAAFAAATLMTALLLGRREIRRVMKADPPVTHRYR